MEASHAPSFASANSGIPCSICACAQKGSLSSPTSRARGLSLPDATKFPARNDLDASFVYLSPSAGLEYNGDALLRQISSGSHTNGNGDLAVAARQLSLLERAVSSGDMGVSDGDGLPLCEACVERVAAAIDADTERIQWEARAYEDAVAGVAERERQIRQALSLNAELAAEPSQYQGRQPDPASGDELVGNAIDAFREEISGLAAAASEYEQELRQLTDLLHEQVSQAVALSREEELLAMDRNDLEIDAKEFESISRHMALRVAQAHREVLALSQVNLHAIQFRVTLEGKGLRYPLINGLRLSHRPKGDLGWSEINAAWAVAAQVLFFVGSTAKFTSRDLRIVPMTTCAKIIELVDKRKVVHNLGKELEHRNGQPPSRRHDNMIPSVRAFNSLLHQVVEHVLSSRKVGEEARPPPFAMTTTTIGPLALLSLDEKSGSAGWTPVIVRLAHNLQWLIDVAALLD